MSNNHIGKMTRSKEDYLKVMLELSGDMSIRSSDIADALGISRASVSSMMRILKEEGYIAKEKYGTITLTESGHKVAVNIKRKYDLLKAFFSDVQQKIIKLRLLTYAKRPVNFIIYNLYFIFTIDILKLHMSNI